MESSHPLRSGDSIKLISPQLNAPKTCLKFYYNMFGDRLGHLRINIVTNNKKVKELWRRSKNQGSNWKHASISITQNTSYKVSVTISTSNRMT